MDEIMEDIVSGEVKVEEDQTEVEILEGQKVEKYHPIAYAIDTYLHRVRDCEYCAKIFIPVSKRLKRRSYQKLLSDFKVAGETINKKHEEAEELAAINVIGAAIRKTERLKKSNIEETLERSLFLKLFSSFDAFTGDLLTAIYKNKPELYTQINREIKLSELLIFETFEDVKLQVLQDEIENFRRKSYIEQFDTLEKRFSIKLKGFDRWKDFIECSQRRNLLTHCDGVVSDQYIKICRESGYCHPGGVNSGDRLGLDSDYFFKACSLMKEVALKLGHTLWRKLFPEEISKSDTYLGSTIFEYLQDEDYKMSEIFGEFAFTLPNISSDLDYKNNLINYAIALKFGNKPEMAKSVLAKVDWSAASNDFKIAEAVLNDRFEDAAIIMVKIGQGTDIIAENSYHEWPLFKEFRKSEVFKKTYESVFGYSFIAELERAADKAEEEIKEEVESDFELKIAINPTLASDRG